MPLGALAMQASYGWPLCQLLGSPRALERWWLNCIMRPITGLGNTGTPASLEHDEMMNLVSGMALDLLSSAVPGLPALTPAMSYAVHAVLPCARPPSASYGTIPSVSHRPPPTFGVAPVFCPDHWSAWSGGLVSGPQV